MLSPWCCVSFKQPVKKVCVLQWRVGEGPRRSSCDLNNFQMEEEKEEVEIKGEEEEDFWVLHDSFYTRNKSEINGQKGTTWNFQVIQALKVRGQSFIQSLSLVLNSVFFPFNVQVFYTFYILYSSCLLSFRRILYSCQRLCTAAVNSSATSPLLSSTPAHRRCICLHFEKDLFQF